MRRRAACNVVVLRGATRALGGRAGWQGAAGAAAAGQRRRRRRLHMCWPGTPALSRDVEARCCRALWCGAAARAECVCLAARQGYNSEQGCFKQFRFAVHAISIRGIACCTTGHCVPGCWRCMPCHCVCVGAPCARFLGRGGVGIPALAPGRCLVFAASCQGRHLE